MIFKPSDWIMKLSAKTKILKFISSGMALTWTVLLKILIIQLSVFNTLSSQDSIAFW